MEFQIFLRLRVELEKNWWGGGGRKKEVTKTNPKQLKPGKCKGGKVLPRKSKHFFSREKADFLVSPPFFSVV